MSKPVIIPLIACLVACTVTAQNTIDFQTLSWTALQKKAQDARKPIMLYFTGTGCTLCKEMEKKVFTEPEVYMLYNDSFLNIKLFDDFYKPDATIKKLRSTYEVVSNPTFIFIDASGKVIHKTRYSGKDKFIRTAREALGNDNYANWSQQLKAGNTTPALLSKYLEAETPVTMYVEEDFQCTAGKMLDQYFAGLPEGQLADSVNWLFIKNYVWDPRSPVFQYLVTHQQLYEKYGPEAVSKKIYDVLNLYISGNRSSPRYQRAFKEVEQMPLLQAQVLLAFRQLVQLSGTALQTPADCSRFIAKADTLVTEYYHWVNVYEVSRWVTQICSHVKDSADLAKTSRWMQLVVSDSANQDYDYYNIYAHNLFLLRDKGKAIKMQQKAIALAEKEEADADEIEDLQQRLLQYRGE